MPSHEVSKELSLSNPIHFKKIHVLWNAYPNPATNEVVIEYSLPEEAKNPVLLIHDSNGKVILLKDLDTKTTQYVWATTTLEIGVYFYTLKYNKRMQQTKQVLIMK